MIAKAFSRRKQDSLCCFHCEHETSLNTTFRGQQGSPHPSEDSAPNVWAETTCWCINSCML